LPQVHGGTVEEAARAGELSEERTVTKVGMQGMQLALAFDD